MLTQGKDDDKEKWQNSRREVCYTLSIEGMITNYIISIGWTGNCFQVVWVTQGGSTKTC